MCLILSPTSHGKEVKSSDKKGVGKIESVTTEYIQTKEGLVSKKYYFIPKQYIQQFDGDSVWVSLTKDDLKGRFEREDVSEIRAEEFQSQSTAATKQLQQRLQKRHRYGGDALGEGCGKKL
jgi:hypothetical protein